PRRNQLLARLGRPFQALDLEVVEQRAATESAEQYVCRVAADKARAGLAQMLADDPQARVLGSDTEVVLDGEVFGKPVDAADARAMLARLAGRT
ncbi:Maf family protein, partial [Mesorhizobium sp. M8A.F.Ca.ET.142.01.1.1]|uniref:Maf family protein n=1 Tax=Mesorhizobium sp. M8A.F.Ca.ET.142.01.1.1 TaxID=2563958 RepID=UPI001AEED6DC